MTFELLESLFVGVPREEKGGFLAGEPFGTFFSEAYSIGGSFNHSNGIEGDVWGCGFGDFGAPVMSLFFSLT